VGSAHPQVSIAMPVFNGARFLPYAIDSILAQTFRDFELVISDNASSDATQDLCEAYAAADSRVRYYRKERNRGAAWNYNNATALSRGEYIKHAAHDDVLAPTYLERCVQALDRDSDVVLAYPRTIHIDENGNRLARYKITLDLRSSKPHERFKEFHNNCNEDSGCDPVFGLMRASALNQTPVIGTYIGADMILLAEMALRGKMVEVPEELFYLRWHPETSVWANPGRDDRGVWFDPANRGSVRNQLLYWEWLYRYVNVIHRVPMGPFEKMRCYRQMPRWVWRKRKHLFGDLVRAAAFCYQRSFPAHAIGTKVRSVR
jgi:glycosyltransferase involved in cell wall biosynthesis